MFGLLKKIFGSRNERVIKRLMIEVERINDLEPALQKLSNQELGAKTQEFKQRLEKGELLDDLLSEAFAVVREASVRTLKLRHFDVQMVGGMVLHHGKIAEMRTGEGKTLAATLPAYLNALTGKGVHIVTVNDYLAKRDAEWMKPIYTLLGLTVGVNLPNMSFEEKKMAYQANIIYGTNNEFGFDYLRDNMAFAKEYQVQRSRYFAIVDEVDSILIDEARTPLIISGPAEESSELYIKIDKLIPKLTKQQEENGVGDYSVDEKTKQAYLTEEGQQKIEELLSSSGLLKEGSSLYDFKYLNLLHHISAALRAHTLFQRDVDYVVKDGEIIIVDEHTGRLMIGRRWSEGLHQAIEAKEKVKIQQENQTLATITFQNFFRLYEKLSGMTGTADTEAYEFQQIYGLEVVVIPTNQPMVREDHADQIYMNVNGKFHAILEEIKERHKKGQPILVGTASIETSEYLSGLLKKAEIQHEVLNAKHHEREAKIIAQAGKPSAITIATNMAGRGTDIVLGGSLEAELAELSQTSEIEIQRRTEAWQKRHEEVIKAGGLHVLGTERNEARRIDNQLRGRSGRQGDPGSSQFYLSLEDSLMRIFASDRVKFIMQKLGMQENEAIQHPLVSKAIENAQRKVEGHNFDIRKHLLEFDDVANDQRKVIYQQRNDLMYKEDISKHIDALIQDVTKNLIERYVPPQSYEEQWDIDGLMKQSQQDFGINLELKSWLEKNENMHEEDIYQCVENVIMEKYRRQEEQFTSHVMRQVEKSVLMQAIDHHWKEHLAAMDHLRQGINLRSYAQVNPAQAYKRESFAMFTQMLDSIKHETVSALCNMRINQEEIQGVEAERQQQLAHQPLQFQHAEIAGLAEMQPEVNMSLPENAGSHIETFIRDTPKVGRNESCPCGSGKKFKQCHGKLA